MYILIAWQDARTRARGPAPPAARAGDGHWQARLALLRRQDSQRRSAYGPMAVGALITLLLPCVGAAAAAASAAAATVVTCPTNMSDHGTTSDGSWLVCELPLATNQYLQLVPAGRLEFHATNGNGTVHTFDKTSEAMFGCNGQNFNATAGCESGSGSPFGGWNATAAGGGDPAAEQVMNQDPAMIYDGGFDMNDPAHGGRRAMTTAGTGWNAHTFTGSRGASQDAVFDSYAGDSNSVGYPTMSPFLGKYQRSTATFKDKMNRLEQREGLWGGYLPVVSFHFKVVGGGKQCDSTPRPCPNGDKQRTYCPNVNTPHQCDTAPKPCPPCPPPGPPGPPGPKCGHCSGHCPDPTKEPAKGCSYPCAKPANGSACCAPCQHNEAPFTSASPSHSGSGSNAAAAAAAKDDDPYASAELSADAAGGENASFAPLFM
jgi:hypothetical protein